MDNDGSVELSLESGRGRSGAAYVSSDKLSTKVRGVGTFGPRSYSNNGRGPFADGGNDLHSPERTFEIQAMLNETTSYEIAQSSPAAQAGLFIAIETPKSDVSEREYVLPRERDTHAMRAILLQGYKASTPSNCATPKWCQARDEDMESGDWSTTGERTGTSESLAGDSQDGVDSGTNRDKWNDVEVAKPDRFREAKSSDNASDPNGNSKTRVVALGLHECLVLKGFKNNKPNLLMDVAMAIWADIGSDTPGKAELERLANILSQHSDLFTVVNKHVFRHSRAAREHDAHASPLSQTACLIRVL
jgi:hypothetical protein